MSEPEDTGTIDPSARTASVTRAIAAEPAAVFAVLRNPALHAVIDGSGTVQAARDSEAPLLEAGATFGMRMRLGVPYVIGNTVVEYEPDRRIAWRHIGGHRWRYEIEPGATPGTCLVTETFDWSTSLFPPYITLLRWPQRHLPAMARTLERLERYVTTGSAD
jgi:uncharacterized protein YndB with AHSA1/START domain